MTTPSKQVAVWIDHHDARVFHVGASVLDEASVAAPLHNIHNKHPRGPEGAHPHPDDLKRYLHDVVQALRGAEEILIVGPSTAKLELHRYMHKHDHLLEDKIIGVETVDHPTDGQLVAYAKTYFKRLEATA